MIVGRAEHNRVHKAKTYPGRWFPCDGLAVVSETGGAKGMQARANTKADGLAIFFKGLFCCSRRRSPVWAGYRFTQFRVLGFGFRV